MWTSEAIKESWRQYSGSFAGDSCAREVVRLSRKYTRGHVLDVGAGSGALLDLIPSAVGIDLVSRHSRVLAASIDNLPYHGNSFETIFATDVLEHLPDDTLFAGLKEINRVLAPGGHLILAVPNNEKLEETNVWCPNCHAEFHRWGHVQIFNTASVDALLWEFGFRMVSARILPLSLMADHFLFRYFWRLFLRFGFCQANDLFVIARKV